MNILPRGKDKVYNTKAATLRAMIQPPPKHIVRRSTSPPPPPNRRETSVDIHKKFTELKVDTILDIIKPIVSKDDAFYTSMDTKSFGNYIYNKFNPYINLHEYRTGLIYILQKVFYCEITPIQKIQIGTVVDYVFMQPAEIIENYTYIFIEENLNAEGTHTKITGKQDYVKSLSCTRGIRERFFTSLKTALLIYCINISKCTPIYKNILRLGCNVNVDNFKQLHKNEITQKWAEEYLHNENFTMNLSEKDREKILKNHYTNFMLQKYREENQETPQNIEMILQEAEKLADFGVFKNMTFGGKKKRRTFTYNKRRAYTKRKINYLPNK